ncbi:MAG: hypothetical protein HYY84_18310 [Deltaproteobacteria bacterium]|nr:hypothetical protein [Deltaproteobacteria bacterium]
MNRAFFGMLIVAVLPHAGCGVEIDDEAIESISRAAAHEAAHVVQYAGRDVRHGAIADCYLVATTGARTTRVATASDSAWTKLVAAASNGKSMAATARSTRDGAWHAYTIVKVETNAIGRGVTRTVTVDKIGLYGTFVHYDVPWSGQPAAGRTVTYTYDDFRRLYDDVYING